MTDTEATKNRILRVLSAICTDGFTAGWRPTQRGFEMRERFFFDSSVRMQKMTGDAETFAIHIQMRHVDGSEAPSASPSPCDWPLYGLVDYIQHLDDDEVVDLPEIQTGRQAVGTMTKMLHAIDDGTWTTVAGTRYRAVTNEDDDPEHGLIIVLTDKVDSLDDQWGAERFLEQGRSA